MNAVRGHEDLRMNRLTEARDALSVSRAGFLRSRRVEAGQDTGPAFGAVMGNSGGGG
jgi:hypothetical protein